MFCPKAQKDCIFPEVINRVVGEKIFTSGDPTQLRAACEQAGASHVGRAELGCSLLVEALKLAYSNKPELPNAA